MLAKRAVSLACLALAALPVLGGAMAQEVTDADELVRQLDIKPEPEQEPKIRTRGITIRVPSADQGRASFNTIQFEYDSATLTPESAAQLNELGKALAHERLAGESFVIEGHADAHGDDQYNKELSQRRAMTVRDYLTTNMGIAEDRLKAVGMGEEKPKTDDPYDPVNRRVDVVNTKAYE
jgi:outer membrane protein OmpA-like peptidoglycan-associated protein